MRVALSLVFVALVPTVAIAQSDKPDFAHAAELYKQAETEMAAGQFSEAARDYAIAFDVTKDPVLFFKIGSADDKAGRCDLALTYYRRYLKEGNPNDEFRTLTTERIAACEKLTGATPGADPDPAAGSAPAAGEAASLPHDPDHDANVGARDRASLAAEKPNKRRSTAWIVLGVGVAFGTVGAVAAISAEAAEKDLQDLYDIRVNNRPPEYTADIAEREKDLIDQGKRYQTLSWVAFGVAGAALAGATVLFITSGGDEAPPVAVGVSAHGATVSRAWSF